MLVNKLKTCSFNVIVSDGGAPSFTSCPTTEVRYTISGQNYAVVDHASLVAATDAVDQDVQVTLTSGADSGSQFEFGTHTIVYTATDDDDNTATCSFVIDVQDQELPSIACPGNINVNTDAAQNFATVSWDAPTPQDNVAISSTTVSTESGSQFTFADSPPSSRFFINTLPPCVSTIRLIIAKPKPLPSVPRALSPWVNG